MEQQNENTDIFLWANNTDGIKKELDVEFFLFNKFIFCQYRIDQTWNFTNGVERNGKDFVVKTKLLHNLKLLPQGDNLFLL